MIDTTKRMKIQLLTEGNIWKNLQKNISDLGFPGGSMVKNLLAMCENGFNPWVRKIPWRRAWQPSPVFLPQESPRTEEPGRLQAEVVKSWKRLSH